MDWRFQNKRKFQFITMWIELEESSNRTSEFQTDNNLHQKQTTKSEKKTEQVIVSDW